MEIRATQKFVVTSPRKLREVAALVKSLSPKDAVERLPYVQKRAAGPLGKVIRTAIANAKQVNIDVEDLFIKEIQINEGPKLKRWRAGARGRAKPYAKRMSHIRVILEVKEAKKRGIKKNKNNRTKEPGKIEGKVANKVISVKTQKNSLKKLKKIISRKGSKSKKGVK